MADIGKPIRKIKIEPERRDPETPVRPEPQQPKEQPTPSR